MPHTTVILIRPFENPSIATKIALQLRQQGLYPHFLSRATDSTSQQAGSLIIEGVTHATIRPQSVDELDGSNSAIEFVGELASFGGEHVIVTNTQVLDAIVSHGVRSGNWFSQPGSIVIMKMDSKGVIMKDGRISMIPPDHMVDAEAA